MKNAASISQWIDKVSQPDYPYYQHVQTLLFGACGYLGAFCFTSISPKKAGLFTALTYTIDRFVAPVFAEALEPYQEVTLVPRAGQIAHITTSMVSSKIICQILREPLSFKDIKKVSFSCLGTVIVVRFVIWKLRQNIEVE